MQKSRSFHVRFVFTVQRRTPAALKISAVRIMSKAGSPALSVYRISTAAPTSTNNITSAANHSLPNFSDRRADTAGTHLNLRVHAIATTASSPETDTFPSSQPSIAIRRKEKPSTIITFMLFLTVCLRAYAVSKNIYSPKPVIMPRIMPSIIDTGIFTKSIIFALPPCATFKNVVNNTITNMSSQEAPDSIIWGIALSVP